MFLLAKLLCLGKKEGTINFSASVCRFGPTVKTARVLFRKSRSARNGTRALCHPPGKNTKKHKNVTNIGCIGKT